MPPDVGVSHMRYLFALLLILGMPLAASAQQQHRSDRPSPYGPGAIGLPLPSIGLPAPVPYQKPWEWRAPAPSWERPQTPAWERQGSPAWERGPETRPNHPSRDPRDPREPRGARGRVVQPYYVIPTYPYYGSPSMQVVVTQPSATYTTPAPPLPPPSDSGRLRLEVEPASLLQIFVDGVFVGTPADLGSELNLRTGPHRIEIRAPGYETLVFDTRIEADRTITYRGELKSTGAKAPAPPAFVAPAGSRTLYVIPGCYLGNVRPNADQLPQGCDLGRMKTHAPQ